MVTDIVRQAEREDTDRVYKNRSVLGLSGKDSLAAALLIKAHDPELWGDLEIFTTLTGADYPETLTWLKSIEDLLGKNVTFIDGNIFASIARRVSSDTGEAFLPSGKVRYCTREAKIQPFEKWLGSDTATLYTGIRVDESRTGYKANNRINSEFPLHKYKFDLAKVWALVLSLEKKYHPPMFYWPEMHQLCRETWDKEFPLFQGRFDELLTYPQKTILMAGRSRPNCFFCFNQRRYEVVWLYETHPELFEKMKSFESPRYSWIKDFPLNDLVKVRREAIKLRRAKAIVKAVSSANFGAVVDDDRFSGMASCGLFCGK